MNRNKLTRKETFRLMKTGWILQYCTGATLGSEWWWVRETIKSSNVKHVHANAAYSIIKNNLVEIVKPDAFTSYYRIKPTTP